MCYITFIYTVDMLRVRPLSTPPMALIGQSPIMSAQYVHCVFSENLLILSLQPSSFKVMHD